MPIVVVEPDGIVAFHNFTDEGDDVRVTIDVSGLAGAGAGGAVVFPPGGAVVTTSFASVSFPAGVAAMSVPPDGLLVLRIVAGDDLPSNSAIQGALAYDGSGAVAVQRMVEVGGVGAAARITFDMPVRISLEGQAGGRAFYMDGADGPVEAIDRACAADDLQRVHRQLGGAGECQLDAGADKVIYTYHLTRFGTVLAESGAPPPSGRECSMRLGLEQLRVDAAPGSRSGEAVQDVTNSGSEPFDRVSLGATPWYIDPSSDRPGPGAPSLPASLTTVREAGQAGAFTALSDAGSMDVARGLGGGLNTTLWFKLDLTAHGELEGDRLVQHVTYTAECGGVSGPQ